MTAIDVSGTIALGAVGLLTLNLLLGLLLSVGYNPTRQWPRRPVKLFTFHNWTGYVALAAVMLHAGALLFSTDPPFRLYDVLVPIESPVQPLSNNLGALGFYLVAIVVRDVAEARALGARPPLVEDRCTTRPTRRRCVFFMHGIIADPLLQNRPVDFIDAEKVYVEVCALVVAATVWRILHRRADTAARSPALHELDLEHPRPELAGDEQAVAGGVVGDAVQNGIRARARTPAAGPTGRSSR